MVKCGKERKIFKFNLSKQKKNNFYISIYTKLLLLILTFLRLK